MEVQFKGTLQAGLRRYMEDVSIEVPFRFINAFARHDASLLASSLCEWSDTKQLKIVRAPADCTPSDVCIVLLRYLDAEPPFDGFAKGVNEQIKRCEYLTDDERHAFAYPIGA